jgi:glycosyltransferase involved in cell wall biosynthesis
MRVGIDAHCLGTRKTGNETYTYNLVKHLARLGCDGIQYSIYVGGEWDNRRECFFDATWFESRIIRPSNPLIRIPVGFALQARRQKLDLFHAQYVLPHHLPCRTVLTVHDVSFERFPEFFTRWDHQTMKLGVRRSCHKADHIITVSEASKRDIVELYGLEPTKVSVTYLGADDSFRPSVDRAEVRRELRKVYGLDEEFILYVGAIQPRKNIPRLLSAFARVKCEQRLPHKLVIVGPEAWLTEPTFRSLEASPVRKDILVTGYVPREHLPYFYNAAAAFVYVSICEGFGLPVVEAMACGTPTITSRGSSLEEVAADAALLVDPTDEDSIASAIAKVVSDSDLRARMRESGFRRSKQFSYQRMANQTQRIYRSLLHSAGELHAENRDIGVALDSTHDSRI